MKLLNIIKKNIIILIKSKASSIAILVGPLVIICILGLLFTEVPLTNIKAVYFSEDYSIDNELFVRLEKKGFSVYQTDTLEECISKVRLEEAHICLEIKKQEARDKANIITEKKQNIIFHIDYSKVNLAWRIMLVINDQIEAISKEFRASIINSFLDQIKDFNRQIKERRIIETFEEQKRTLRTQVDTLENIVDSINTNFDYVSSYEIQSLSSQLDSIDNSLAYQENNLEKNLDSIDYYASQLPSNFSERTLIQEKVKNIRDETNLDYIRGEVNDIQDMAEDLEDTASRTSSGINTIENRKGNLIREISKVQAAINTNIAKIDEMIELLRDAQEDAEQFESVTANDILYPISTSIKPVGGGGVEASNLGAVDYVFPTLITIILIFIVIIFSTNLVIRERISKAHFRNDISPTSKIWLLFGNFLTCFIIIAVQVAVMFFIAHYFVNISFLSNIYNIILILALVITCFIIFGMALGYLFQSQLSAIMGSVSISLLMLFLSSSFKPVELMPGYIAKVVSYSPFVIVERSLTNIIIFGDTFINTVKGNWTIIIFLIISVALLIIFNLLNYKKDISE